MWQMTSIRITAAQQWLETFKCWGGKFLHKTFTAPKLITHTVSIYSQQGPALPNPNPASSMCVAMVVW